MKGEKQKSQVEYIKSQGRAERFEKSSKRRKRRLSKDEIFERRWN